MVNGEKSASIQCSVFNLTFEIVICHPTTSNSCCNVVLPQLPLYCDTTRVDLDEEKPYNAQLPPGIIC